MILLNAIIDVLDKQQTLIKLSLNLLVLNNQKWHNK
jgi:hypothetical protein